MNLGKDDKAGRFEVNRRDFISTITTASGMMALGAFPMEAAPAAPTSQASNSQEQNPQSSPTTYPNVLYIAPDGNDQNPGTVEKPFATLEKAKNAVRDIMKTSREPVRVLLREGTHYLQQPLELGPDSSGTAEAPVTYAAYAGERVTLSGGRRLECNWQAYQGGIMMCELPDVKAGRLDFTQLFINGERQIRARYPNYDNSRPGKSGYINPAGIIPADTVDPQPGSNDDMVYDGVGPRGILFNPASFTQKTWARPKDAVIHIFRSGYWGSLQWRIKTIDYAHRSIWFGDGGNQMGAKWDPNPPAIDRHCRFFIENVFEELDAPGEWYLDTESGILYFMPPPDLDLQSAVVEVPVLESVVRLVGSQDRPASHITFDGFRIAHTTATYMGIYEVPSLSDWSIHRDGAIFLEGSRDCTIRNCWFDAVGGNAVFVSKYNRNAKVSGCKFTKAGDSAVVFVGSLDLTSGTQRAFPYECQAYNNLIHDCGVFGKQSAGIYISRAKRITASHNLIYNMPRAAICIGDGTWGGHIIEFNHTHDTVRETGDHGPFNAWGRDKYWCLTQSHMPYTIYRSIEAGRVNVDVMEPMIIRNNFFEEHPDSIEGVHGPVFGLDLDDGASNYEIYNNITKGISMKLREGANRTVYNNIWFDSVVAPCFQVGNEYNHDRFFNNITVMSRDDVYVITAPPARGPWLEEIDNNCLFKQSGEFTARVELVRGEQGPDPKTRSYDLEGWRGLGFDVHSVFADPMFVDAEHNDFRVQLNSPALKLGFKNFDMGQWGLTDEFPAIWRE